MPGNENLPGRPQEPRRGEDTAQRYSDDPPITEAPPGAAGRVSPEPCGSTQRLDSPATTLPHPALDFNTWARRRTERSGRPGLVPIPEHRPGRCISTLRVRTPSTLFGRTAIYLCKRRANRLRGCCRSTHSTHLHSGFV